MCVAIHERHDEEVDTSNERTVATEELVSPLTTPTTNFTSSEGSNNGISSASGGRSKIRKKSKQVNQERIDAKVE